MASLDSHNEDPLSSTELILQEDSKNELETRENYCVTFEEYFGVNDDELNKSFYGFEKEYDVMEKKSKDESGEKLEIAQSATNRAR